MTRKCYLFTEVKLNGQALDEGDDNVVVFAKSVTLNQLIAAFSRKGFSWDEAYEIPGKDVQFHIHQALYLDDAMESRAKGLAVRK